MPRGMRWWREKQIAQRQELRDKLEANKIMIVESLNAGGTMTAVAKELGVELPYLSTWVKANTRKRYELKGGG